MLINWNKITRKSLALASISLFIFHFSFFISPLRACQLCFPFPIKSAADHLLENELVVFARLNPDDKFSFVITRELKGHPETKKLDYFADSATRRRLEAYPENVVIFVRGKDADDWRSLGIADQRYQQAVERIVAHEHIWSGKQGEQKRIEFFMQLFDNEHQAIFELAYLELGRAPYSTIRKVGQLISKERMRSILTRREYIEWRPLAILLLAQNPNEEDRKLLTRTFEACKKFPQKKELAACLTAYIEMNGVSAIDEIEAVWLNSDNRPVEEIKLVITALFVQQKCGNTAIRNRISRCMEKQKGIFNKNYEQTKTRG